MRGFWFICLGLCTSIFHNPNPKFCGRISRAICCLRSVLVSLFTVSYSVLSEGHSRYSSLLHLFWNCFFVHQCYNIMDNFLTSDCSVCVDTYKLSHNIWKNWKNHENIRTSNYMMTVLKFARIQVKYRVESIFLINHAVLADNWWCNWW